MDELVRIESEGDVARLTMDDGKLNVLSPAMQAALHRALDDAAGASAVVLAGRPGTFTAGFDLATLRGGGAPARDMVIGGFELALRLLTHPRPVVIACTGHAIAMGSFLLLAGDDRIGVDGPARIVANEVAIGLIMPWTATALLRGRLTPSAFQQALGLSQEFEPSAAVAAGFLDRVVAEDDVTAVALDRAVRHAGLDARAHADSKARARAPWLAELEAAIERDREELTELFVG